jgi:hypothetical protein
MHFVYNCCDGNAAAASSGYQCWYPDQGQPECFAVVHHSLGKWVHSCHKQELSLADTICSMKTRCCYMLYMLIH